MSANRVKKDYHRISSTQRRHNAAALVKQLGRQFFEMGRCSNCILSDSPCWMVEGQSMCNTCRGKNKKVGECDGCFSISDFDSLTDQREKMESQIREKDRRIGDLIAALTAAQKEKDNLVQSSERLLSEQKKMLNRELMALDAIDALDDSSNADSSTSRLAYALDPAFEPALQQMVRFSGDPASTGPQVSG